MDFRDRVDHGARIAREAGDLALRFFRAQDSLKVEQKGHQDFVSQADRDVETFVRQALAAAFPDDSIVGEEHAPTVGTSGVTWVIDPIDGTTNFVNGIPAWTVVLAGVADGKTQFGVIHDPCHDEIYTAMRGQGAQMNGTAMHITSDRGMTEGTVGIGFSNRTSTKGIDRLISAMLAEGGVFYRNASGALSLAYVASGRLLGYAEDHMNAWDCLAGQLLVAEAGGVVETQDADSMIARGGRVIVGTPRTFPDLLRLCETAFVP
jgi:myo-inositol-1(or 4)-monophosphatase